MQLETILRMVEDEPSYTSGLCIGIVHMQQYHGWRANEWVVDFNDIASDYRTFITTIKHLIKQKTEPVITKPLPPIEYRKIKRIFCKGERGKYAGYMYTPHRNKSKQYMLIPKGDGNKPDNAHYVLTLEEVLAYLKRGWSVRVSNSKSAASARVLSAMTIEYYDE